jgi:hypothetical protein
MTATLQERAGVEESFRNRAEQLLDAVLGELDEVVGGLDVQRTMMKDRHPAEALLEVAPRAEAPPSTTRRSRSPRASAA